MLPREGGKPLTWDITVANTLAQSYIHTSSHMAGGAAELAASRKEAKYSCLTQSHIFQPIALETLSTFASSTCDFICDVGRWLSAASGDICDTAFLSQRLAITIQRFNSVLLLESFGDLDTETDCWPF